MTSKLNRMIEKLSPRTIFLVDGMGALLSTLLLVFLLAPYPTIFGMSQRIIYALSMPAAIFTIYSMGCYLLNIQKWKPYLQGIAIANCLYCLLTFWLLIQQYKSLTMIGLAYFIGEIIVVLLVVNCELIMIRKPYLQGK